MVPYKSFLFLCLAAVLARPAALAQSISRLQQPVYSIMDDSSGGYYTASRTSLSNFRIGRLNSQTGKAWVRDLHLGGHEHGSQSLDLLPVSRDRFLLVSGLAYDDGIMYGTDTARLAGIVALGDTSGQLAWARGFQGPDSSCDVECAVRARTGEVYVAGKYIRNFESPLIPIRGVNFLAKLSPQGDLLWYRTLADTGDADFSRLSELFVEPDGNLRYFFSRKKYPNGYRLHSLLLDTAGNILDAKLARLPWLAIIPRIIRTSTHYFLVHREQPGLSWPGWVYRFRRSDLVMDKAASFDDLHFSGLMEAMPDGGFVFGGVEWIQPNSADYTRNSLIRMDSSLQVVWSRYYGQCGSILFWSRHPLAPGSNYRLALLMPQANLSTYYLLQPNLATGSTCIGSEDRHLQSRPYAPIDTFWHPNPVVSRLRPIRVFSYAIQIGTKYDPGRMVSQCTGEFTPSLLGPSVTTCLDTVVLQPRGFYVNPLWSTGDTVRVLAATHSGLYSVRVNTDTCGIATAYDSARVTILPPAQPFHITPAQALLCPGGSVPIRIRGSQPDGVRYQWPTMQGLVQQSDTSGLYQAPIALSQPIYSTLRITASQCDSTTTDSALIGVVPLPFGSIDTTLNDSTFHIQVGQGLVDSILVMGGSLVSYDTATGQVTVRWNRTDTLFAITAILSNTANCPDTVSIQVRLPVGIKFRYKPSVWVWPSPASDALHLSEPIRHYRLQSLAGTSILAGETASKTLRLPHLASGTYILQGEAAHGPFRTLVVIAQ